MWVNLKKKFEILFFTFKLLFISHISYCLSCWAEQKSTNKEKIMKLTYLLLNNILKVLEVFKIE